MYEHDQIKILQVLFLLFDQTFVIVYHGADYHKTFHQLHNKH